MDLNLKAPFFMAQRVGSEMIKQGGGKIVNLASQAGVIALDRHVAYCASKAAIISMTKVLALEWAKHNIQVNAISPWFLPNSVKKHGPAKLGEQMKKDSSRTLCLSRGDRRLCLVFGQ